MKVTTINETKIGVERLESGSYEIYVDGKLSCVCKDAPEFEDTFRVILGNIGCYDLDYLLKDEKVKT